MGDPSATRAPAAEGLDQRLWTVGITREHGFEPLEVEGAIPADLRGTLVRNGPGKFDSFGRRYAHPFEGDGAITAVRFEHGRALGASRLTETAGLVAERAAGRPLFDGALPWHRRVLQALRGAHKNTANTSVMMWQGRLFALMEGARPTELSPSDLAMIGETDLDGVIVSAFSAHPHRVAARHASYNFGLEYGRHTRLHCYELPETGAARHLTAIPLPGPTMVHDFIATQTHLIFFLSPIRMSLPRVLLQLGSFDRWFQWRPELGTEIVAIPIEAPSEPVRFTVDTFFQWHFANAFTRGAQLVVDYARYPDFSSFHDFGDARRQQRSLAAGRYHRATIDLSARRMHSEPIADVSCEFPTVAPRTAGREHAFAYGAFGELGAVGKLDLTTGALATHPVPRTQRASEPLFIPRAGAIAEDDGYVLSLCHDGPSDRAFLAVYDAARLPDGPIARAWFDHHVPITFHGTWNPAASS